MRKIRAVLRSMRLRTLPLSSSGVITGVLLAVADFQVRPLVALLILLTTVSLQVLSNLCNELGDVLHGTDRPDRKGPAYGLNGGDLTVGEMKVLIGIRVLLCVGFGLWMIRASFGTLLSLDSVCLMLLGAAAILGAMRYTLGRHPYGYRGLGDAFVFLFFGPVAVLGSYFVAAHTLDSWLLVLPAAAIGFFSVGVLNVNNMRDMQSDAATRTTVALRLGLRGARIYQTALIALGWACLLAFCLLRFPDPWHYLFVLTLPLYGLHLRGVWTRADGALDPMLPLLVGATFALSLLLGIGFTVFLW